jgi:hypothetical protein
LAKAEMLKAEMLEPAKPPECDIKANPEAKQKVESRKQKCAQSQE